MKKQRFTVLLTIICLLMTMTCSVNVYAADTIGAVSGVKLVQPASSIHAIPDRYYDIENPLNGKTNRDCSISAETLWTLAERTYAAGETEFYINTAFSDKEIEDIDIEIETGMYPFSSEGKLCSMGILTADGYMHIGAQAALTLLNDSLYSKISIDTKLQRAGQYRITMTGIKLDGSSEEFFCLPEGSVTFTFWPDEYFAGKQVKYTRKWFNDETLVISGDCLANTDGTITFAVAGTGDYTLKVYEEPAVETIPEHTLEIINENYGYVDMDGSNRYVPGAEAGCYLQDVFINGVSQGPLTKITVSEGAKIVVVFAKSGETVDTTPYDTAAQAKIAKTKAGIQATTIKASTVSGVKKGVKITWKKSAGYKVDYYEIWRSTKKSSGFKKTYTTASGSKTSYTNTKITKGTRYYYRVRGVRKLSGEKIYTKWSNTCYRKAA